MKTIKSIILIFAIVMTSASLRAEVPDRVWPSNYGDAHLCLWKNDAIGAISYTIDDNTAIEHDWWIDISNKYGFRVTWFVITERVIDGPVGTGGWAGTWDDWRMLYGLGHDIQSHTVTHRVYEDNIDYEYSYSKQTLEEEIPGNKVLTMAYPSPGTYENDPEVAKKYYIGCRGVGGQINKADEIEYMNTRSISSFNYDPDYWTSITNIIKRNPSRTRDYRGWQCMHFHSVEDRKDNLIQGFEFVKALGDDMWTGKFREVILYVQERDTASVNVTRATASQIELSVSDQKDNIYFDYPLTIKVKLDNSWGNISAVQNGHAVQARLINYDGKRYALVDIVPDRGVAVLTKQGIHPINVLGDVTGDGNISSYDASLAAQHAVGLTGLTADAAQRADVTENGEVSSYDASLIAQYAIGLISEF